MNKKTFFVENALMSGKRILVADGETFNSIFFILEKPRQNRFTYISIVNGNLRSSIFQLRSDYHSKPFLFNSLNLLWGARGEIQMPNDQQESSFHLLKALLSPESTYASHYMALNDINT